MKRCPECGRTFTNNTLINCLNDGTVLVEDVPAPPPYFGAPSAADPPSFAETPDNPAAKTYTDTPLSAIPELQSPEMQAALKEALDKAGMSSLFGADLSTKSTVSVTTNTTTSQSDTPFAYPQTPSPGFAQTPPPDFAQTPPPGFTEASPYYAGAAAPRRSRSPWGIAIAVVLGVFALLALVGVAGFLALRHAAGAGVPADIVASVKTADADEAGAVRTLDPGPLAASYTGPALAQELARLASLKAAQTSVDERLVSQEFSGYQASPDGTQAKVDVMETWDTETYSEPGHTLVSQKSGDVNPQTVFLARTPSGWRVEKIVFHHS